MGKIQKSSFKENYADYEDSQDESDEDGKKKL